MKRSEEPHAAYGTARASDDSDDTARAMAADREALRRQTARGLPDLAHTAAALHAARSEPTRDAGDREGGAMLDEKRGAARRRWTGALVTAAVAAALLVVPLPYGRTVGYDVSIRISGATRPGAVKAAAATWRRQSGATGLRVIASDERPGGAEMESRVPLRSRRQLDQLVAAFSDGLRERGMQVKVEIEPRRERTWGSVFAMARDKVPELRLDTTQSAEALAASIRAQLDEAGLPDADVQVHKDGDETQVEINAQGGEPGGPRVVKQLHFKVRGDGEARAPLGGQPVERTPGMTDQQYRDAIVEKLRADGIEDAEVTVSGGRVEVRARREGP